MFERFTKDARDVVVRAQVEARGLGHSEIGDEHLVLAALGHPHRLGVAGLGDLGVTRDAFRAALEGGAGKAFDADDAEALRTLGIDLDEIRRQVEGAFGEGALERSAGGSGRRRLLGRLAGGHIPFTSKAKQSLTGALREAQARGDRELRVEHILLGTLAVDGRAVQLLGALDVSPAAARAAVLTDLEAAA